MKMLSLCSGIGGIDLAAEWAGIEVIGQVEIDPFCQAVLAKHWPGVQRLADIHEVRGDEFGAVDLVAGGFPCQPTSYAGKRAGAADDRWLWPEVYRIIQNAQPAWIVLENVPGLVSLGLDEVLADLESQDYVAQAFLVPACAVDAPHLRERVFIVAYAGCEGQQCRGLSDGPAQTGAIFHMRLGNSGKALAYPCSGRCERIAFHEGQETARRGRAGEVGAMVNASGAGWQERHHAAEPGSARYVAGRSAALWSDGQAQPRLGRDVNGLSRRMDGPRWPARPGEAQHAWEPPRTTQERITNRAARLKALGNAVVPQQIYPIFAAIIAAEHGEKGGR